MPLLLQSGGATASAGRPDPGGRGHRATPGHLPPFKLAADRIRPAGADPTPAATVTATSTPAPTTTTTTVPPPPSTTTTTTEPPPPPTTTTTTQPPAPAVDAAGTGYHRVGIVTYYRATPGTCASPTLPFGTVVTVTNPANGASVSCVVDDREADTARQIDLATATFAEIAPLSQGVIPDAELSW